MTVNKNELKLVLEKLDTVKLELLRLSAMLLPEEEATAEEKKELKLTKKETAEGSIVITMAGTKLCWNDVSKTNSYN